MEAFETITPYLLQYGWIAVFFGAFFFGETVIVTAATVVFTQGWSLPLAFLFALLGTLTSDFIWFLLGQRILGPKMMQSPKWKKNEEFIRGVSARLYAKPFLILLFIKFLYGTRILMIVYLSVRNISSWVFLLFNTIGTVLWLLVLFGLSYLAVVTSTSLFDGMGMASKIITGILAAYIFVKLLSLWTTKYLAKK